MNARTQLFELSMEGRQVDEAVASIFHSVLFHRSLGKFKYKQEGSYSVGTVGYQDVDCDFIDFTYVCCSSVHLDQTLKREISGFSEALRSTDSPGSGQISLEFFQRKKSRWPFQPECIPWEVWTVRLELIKLATEHERQICREKVLPCYSRNSNSSTPRTRESCRGDKICNGNNTMQETLLPSNTKAQNPEGCEMIILEQTTNISKELDQPSSSSKDFNDVAL